MLSNGVFSLTATTLSTPAQKEYIDEGTGNELISLL